MKRSLFLTLLLLPFASGCEGTGPSLGERLQPVDCWFNPDPAGPATRCYQMRVPEDHARPDGRQIRFPVVVFTADRRWWQRPKAPVLHLGGGGPGHPLGLTTEAEAGYLWHDYRQLSVDRGRDLIAIDPRGVGLAEPRLVCTEFIDTAREALPRALAPKEEDRQVRTAYARCRDRLIAEGVDLSQYRSASVAADVELMRHAFGVEQWHLYGVSYASRYALTVARDYPAGVASMVLDGVVFPQVRYPEKGPALVNVALSRALSRCHPTYGCPAGYQELVARLPSLLAALDERPARMEVIDPWSGRPQSVALTGRRLVDALFMALYVDRFNERLPGLLLSLHQEDTAPAEEPVTALIGDLLDPYYADGAQLSHYCAEELPFADLDKARRKAMHGGYFGELALEGLEASVALCELWRVPTAPAVESRPVRTDIPTLLLHGELDPVLPAEDVPPELHHFPNGILLLFSDVAHGAIYSSLCAEEAAGVFIERGAAALSDLACIEEEALVGRANH